MVRSGNNINLKFIILKGVYYYLIKKYETARKYFQKANMLNRNYTYS